jgi:hypothetical protein
MSDDTNQTEELLQRAKAGDGPTLAELFEHYRIKRGPVSVGVRQH